MSEVNFLSLLLPKAELLKVTISVILTPIAVMSVYYGIGYGALMRFVDPSFELKSKRLIELFFAFYICSIGWLIVTECLGGYFNIEMDCKSPYRTVIPSVLYVVFRCIVRFHSPKIARDHLNNLTFVIAIGLVIEVIRVGIMGGNIHIDNSNYTNSLFFTLAILSIVVVMLCEVLLSVIGRCFIYNKFIIKKLRLIDISEELPTKSKIIFGKENVNKKIHDIICDNHDRHLKILTNTYTTVVDNIEGVVARNRRRNLRGRKSVSIIGSSDTTNPLIIESQKKLRENNVPFCRGEYDGVRVLIDGNRRILASYATSGNKGSHVGIYSEHAFVVSLFRSYFETKCRSIKCENPLCRSYDLNRHYRVP